MFQLDGAREQFRAGVVDLEHRLNEAAVGYLVLRQFLKGVARRPVRERSEAAVKVLVQGA
jgi:hypothetical protein